MHSASRSFYVFLIVMLAVLQLTRGVQLRNRALRVSRTSFLRPLCADAGATSTDLEGSAVAEDLPGTGDILTSGLNADQDIIVRVVSCRELVQELMLRNDLSPQAAKSLGEVMLGSVMMGAGLKEKETLQVNLVGTRKDGVRNVMCITDGEANVRGMVGNPSCDLGTSSPLTRDLFGEGGQVQVVRNHPSFKLPMSGFTALREGADVALNLALYMQESEQRPAVLLTDVKVTGALCRHALGVLVEQLPGATEANVERSIKNLEEIEKRGLRSYLDRTPEQRAADAATNEGAGAFRTFGGVMEKVLDDCFLGMDEGASLRWDKTPSLRCGCSVDKVWTTLRLLPRAEVEDIVATHGGPVEIKCEFCGSKYGVELDDIQKSILNVPPEGQGKGVV